MNIVYAVIVYLPVDLVQHVLQDFDEDLKLFQIQTGIHCVRYQYGHYFRRNHVHGQTVLFVPQYHTVYNCKTIRLNTMLSIQGYNFLLINLIIIIT